MAKRPVCFFGLFLLLFVFSGCNDAEKSGCSLPGMVVGVRVSCAVKGMQLERDYSSYQDVDFWLNYVNDLRTCGKAKRNPEYIDGEFCQITLLLSGGGRHIYRVMDGKYLSVNCKAWQRLSKELPPVFPLLEQPEIGHIFYMQ